MGTSSAADSHLTGPVAPASSTAALVRPRQMRGLLRTLRPLVGAHSDVAWVIPCPSGRDRDPVTNLSHELLDALGVVGLTPQRHRGESHLLRPRVHLEDGHVTDLVVYDAAHLQQRVLETLQHTVVAAGVNLWLILDNADGPSRPGAREDLTVARLDWVRRTCRVMDADVLVQHWSERGNLAADCTPMDPGWWFQDARTEPLPRPCPDHTQIECLLARTRRALTTGPAAPNTARLRLTELSDHPDLDPADRWELAMAGRDFYNPGMDALAHTHPAATLARIADVAVDGSFVRVAGSDRPVAPMMRPALRRLRLSRVLAHCPDSAPMRGVFDQDTELTAGRRRW